MAENPYAPPQLPSERPRLFPWNRVLTLSALWTGVWFLFALLLRPVAISNIHFETLQRIGMIAFFAGVPLTIGAYLAKRRQEIFFR